MGGRGINRVSLGVQSFVDGTPPHRPQAHARRSSRRDLAMLRAAGIAQHQYRSDRRTPVQTEASWRESLEWIARLDPPHVSVYMLEVDEDSRLGTEICSAERATARAMRRPKTQIADFLRDRRGAAGAHGIRALRDLEFRAARLRIAAQPEVLAAANRTSASAPMRIHSMAHRDGRIVESVEDYLTLAAEPRPNRLPRDAREEEKFFVGLRLLEGVGREPKTGSAIARRSGVFWSRPAGTSRRRLRLTNRGVIFQRSFQEFH